MPAMRILNLDKLSCCYNEAFLHYGLNKHLIINGMTGEMQECVWSI